MNKFSKLRAGIQCVTELKELCNTRPRGAKHLSQIRKNWAEGIEFLRDWLVPEETWAEDEFEWRLGNSGARAQALEELEQFFKDLLDICSTVQTVRSMKSKQFRRLQSSMLEERDCEALQAWWASLSVADKSIGLTTVAKVTEAEPSVAWSGAKTLEQKISLMALAMYGIEQHDATAKERFAPAIAA